MTIIQEDAFYEFLEKTTVTFSLEDAVAYVKSVDSKKAGRLGGELEILLSSRNIAFRLGNGSWLSRRGCFEPIPFVISPTRLELLNGILIPGHRCLPFSNPVLMPHELSFFWKGGVIPVTTTEGPPEELYPYYCIFGEEYAPQYVARDNPENEAAFNADPYEDPPEVSIRTLDMRNVYRESGFVPGDRFLVRSTNWKLGTFSLERVGKDDWSEEDLALWVKHAETAFEDSFTLLGPGMSTEEQITYAYWYGGKEIRQVPAYSLEEFLYEKTGRIETVAYGIETRFWFAGKEIPDSGELAAAQFLPDRTLIEDMLHQKQVPISEFVIQSYVRDALFRGDTDMVHIMERVVPPVVSLDEDEWDLVAAYISDALDEFGRTYTFFTDKAMGPIRQRVGELHTAVIELAARLGKGDIDFSWLPKHTFIVLSQIQGHAAGVLEDLDTVEAPAAQDLEMMDNSLDSMIETYEDIKQLIEDALDSFRRNKLSVVKGNKPQHTGRLIQVSIGGLNVWRRIIVPEAATLEDLHRVIQRVFDWSGNLFYQFVMDNDYPDTGLTVAELGEQEPADLVYEYGNKWTVKIILLSRYEGEAGERFSCAAGAGAAPPEQIEGPLRFRRYLSALERGTEADRQAALIKLGSGFDPEFFDLAACNRSLVRAGLGARGGSGPEAAGVSAGTPAGVPAGAAPETGTGNGKPQVPSKKTGPVIVKFFDR